MTTITSSNNEISATGAKRNIKLLLGSYRSGKTDRILSQVIDHCQGETLSEAIIVVPSERYKTLLEKRIFKLSIAKHREQETAKSNPFASESDSEVSIPFSAATLLKEKPAGIFGLRLLTFYQYCQLILNRCGVFPRLIPDSVRPRIIQILLDEARENGALKMLARPTSSSGIARTVLELIDELERSGLSPIELKKLLQQTAGQSAPQLEYTDLYRRYWETLEQIDFIDKHQLAYKIRELAPRAQLSMAPSIVAFDGFDRFSPLQLQMIAGNAHFVDQIIMGFDYLPPEMDANDEYSWKHKTYKTLVDHLAPHLTIESVLPSKSKPEKTLSVFSSGDRYLEMAQIASLIKEAMIKGNVKAEEILVVTRRLENYAEAAEAAFHDAGIDYFIDQPVALNCLPLIKFLRTFISLSIDNFSRANVIFCWQSPYFKRQEIALTLDDVAQLDKLSRRGKVIGTKEQWLAVVDKESPDLRAGLGEFFRIWEGAPESCSTYSYVNWLEDLLDQFLVLPDHDSAVDSYTLWQTRGAMGRLRACFATLLSEENVLQSLGKVREQKQAVHLERLLNLIETANFPRIPQSNRAVLVCGAEMAPNRSYDEVYIAGLVEGEFPKRVIRGGLLTSDQVGIWESYGVDLHNSRFEPGFEIALLTALKERARHKVVMSCPRFDMNGEELTPAFYFTEQANQPDAQRESGDYFHTQRSLPVSARAFLSSIAWTAGNEEFRQSISETVHPLVSELEESLSEAQTVARIRAFSPLANGYNGFLKEFTETGALKITLPQYFSASQFGQYGKCPHQYWLSNLVKIKALEEPAEGLNERECGSTYHKALELFYSKLITDRKSIAELDETQLKELSLSSINAALDKVERDPGFRPGPFWDYQKREISFRLEQFLQAEYKRAQGQSPQYKPLAVECQFGYDEKVPALKMTVGEETIAIRGCIDRIDEAVGTGSTDVPPLRIIDYKRGTTFLGSDLQAGRELQLPLYALAVQQCIYKGSKVDEGEYLSVHARKPVGKLFPKRGESEYADDPLAFCAGKINEFVDGIKQGIFVVKPSVAANCSKCEHRPICRINELIVDKITDKRDAHENDEVD